MIGDLIEGAVEIIAEIINAVSDSSRKKKKRKRQLFSWFRRS